MYYMYIRCIQRVIEISDAPATNMNQGGSLCEKTTKK